MQTSETYMITWRARAHQQYDFVLLLICQTKRGNPGTRRSPDDNPRPFTWTKTADEILNSLADYLAKVGHRKGKQG